MIQHGDYDSHITKHLYKYPSFLVYMDRDQLRKSMLEESDSPLVLVSMTKEEIITEGETMDEIASKAKEIDYNEDKAVLFQRGSGNDLV